MQNMFSFVMYTRAEYENEKQTGENFIGCESGKPPNQEEKVCRFNLDVLGARCTWQQAYGYDEGTPCILFKLNKVNLGRSPLICGRLY